MIVLRLSDNDENVVYIIAEEDEDFDINDVWHHPPFGVKVEEFDDYDRVKRVGVLDWDYIGGGIAILGVDWT